MGLFKGRTPTSGLCRLDNCNNSERSSRKFIKTQEAPYQMLGKRTLAATLGYKELNCSHFWLSILSECLSCYLYVFIVCSTRISWTGAIIGHEPNLLAMSLTSGIAMMLLIFTFRTVHVNPALSISFLLTGRIPIVRALLYIVVQCMGSVAAIAFLYSISIKGHSGALGLDNPHDALKSWQILIVEIVISFVVTLATYATCNYSSYNCAKRETLEQLGKGSISNNNYDYEYDNHRIYATQQLKSESSTSQVPIEEIMQEECQLLAPNGFSLHVTSGQAFVIGLAYALTSLSGIPASGASLNPARSFGPAFIMNRWDRHWIYWLGPILGAVIAGFFYEFIFSPTRKSSLCYRPKLFRFSAQDMAKVGSKSRLYQQQQQQKFSATIQPSSTLFRPQTFNPTIQHSPSNRALAGNSTLLKSSQRDPQLITISTSVAHLQPPFPMGSALDQMNFLQQQGLQRTHTANFDRSKSTAIIDSISAKQHQQQNQSIINIPQRNNPDFGLSIDRSRSSQMAANLHEQVVYDDPTPMEPNFAGRQQSGALRQQQLQPATPGETAASSTTMGGGPSASNRLSLNVVRQQRFEFSQAPANLLGTLNRELMGGGGMQPPAMKTNGGFNGTNHHKPFNTVHSNSVRPHSLALTDQVSFQQHQFHHQQQQIQRQYGKQLQYLHDNGQLDDDLYNVLSEPRGEGDADSQDGGIATSKNARAQSNEPDYSNQVNAETSDSSQRTNEMLNCSNSSSDRLQASQSAAFGSGYSNRHSGHFQKDRSIFLAQDSSQQLAQTNSHC